MIVHVRAEFPDINQHYSEYLLTFYDESYYPEKMRRAGRAVYVERNREMIGKSKICAFFCNKSTGGTQKALTYAQKAGKQIINLG